MHTEEAVSVFGVGSLWVDAQTSMSFQGGTVNAQVYRDDILDAYVRPYVGAIGDAFLLQEDNARPHRACIVDDYLQQERIMRMEWQARSPDFRAHLRCFRKTSSCSQSAPSNLCRACNCFARAMALRFL
ncbi:hypothetical protein X975_23465, partial [Stegodyphus mimosarum]